MKFFLNRTGALFLLASVVMSGCYAGVRGTVMLVEGDQELARARAAGAPSRALYEWTMADEYMKKARDEWARSDFESAEKMVGKAKQWAAEAAVVAKTSGPGPIDDLDNLDPEPNTQPETKPENESSWGEDEGGW